jgi:hypothetical protein
VLCCAVRPNLAQLRMTTALQITEPIRVSPAELATDRGLAATPSGITFLDALLSPVRPTALGFSCKAAPR